MLSSDAPMRKAYDKQCRRSGRYIPAESELQTSGHEWLLRLIDKSDAESAGRLVLILWRAWFVRNELTHTSRKLSIWNSVNFLSNYWESLVGIRQEG